jgi:hypothetical protein
VWDFGVPLLIAAAGVFELYTPACISCRAPAEHGHHPGSRLDNLVFLLAICPPLVWRRRHPVAVCVAVLVVQPAWHLELYSSIDFTLRWRRGDLGIEVVGPGPGPVPSDEPSVTAGSGCGSARRCTAASRPGWPVRPTGSGCARLPIEAPARAGARPARRGR